MIVTEAVSSSCPPDEQTVNAAPGSVQRQAHKRLAQTAPAKLVGYHSGSQSDNHALPMIVPVGGSVRRRSGKDERCSFCRAELGGSLELTIPGSGKHGSHDSTGCFCSAYCRDCVLALAALHPSPLASDAFISQRSLLTDRLLDLWRHGRGPDPGLVLQAAKRAGCGLPAASPAVACAGGRACCLSPTETAQLAQRVSTLGAVGIRPTVRPARL